MRSFPLKQFPSGTWRTGDFFAAPLLELHSWPLSRSLRSPVRRKLSRHLLVFVSKDPPLLDTVSVASPGFVLPPQTERSILSAEHVEVFQMQTPARPAVVFVSL